MGIASNTRKVVEDTFKTAWAGATPIKYPNVPWKQPAGVPWVEIDIRWGPSSQTSIASKKREEQTGIVVVSIHAPLDAGSKASYDLADLALAALRFRQIQESTTTVNFYAGAVSGAYAGPTAFNLSAMVRFTATDEF